MEESWKSSPLSVPFFFFFFFFHSTTCYMELRSITTSNHGNYNVIFNRSCLSVCLGLNDCTRTKHPHSPSHNQTPSFLCIFLRKRVFSPRSHTAFRACVRERQQLFFLIFCTRFMIAHRPSHLPDPHIPCPVPSPSPSLTYPSGFLCVCGGGGEGEEEEEEGAPPLFFSFHPFSYYFLHQKLQLFSLTLLQRLFFFIISWQ